MPLILSENPSPVVGGRARSMPCRATFSPSVAATTLLATLRMESRLAKRTRLLGFVRVGGKVVILSPYGGYTLGLYDEQSPSRPMSTPGGVCTYRNAKDAVAWVLAKP